ncbi:Cerevisin [Arthrobotrys entomopaga]|nr:Cerevisin [Arthrobotrys entomopaga]
MLHPEFEGRAKLLFTAFPDDLWDISGHETLVAGVIGSTTFGVAKKASLWALKIQTVLITDGPGQMPEDNAESEANAAISGLQAALKFHNKRKKQKDFKGSVMNLSWGYDKMELPYVPGFDARLREAMVNATKAGMHITIAPNNANLDACNNFPAAYVKDIPSLVVVGSTDATDTRAGNSDWGNCIDLFAPGVNITGPTSADKYGFKKTDPKFRVDAGTSFAAPIVAGVIASELAKHPELRDDPLGMKKLILGNALKGVVKDTKGSPNLLLNTGIGGN